MDFAVAWTDLLQGILMIGTLVILPLAGLIELADSDISILGGLESADRVFKNYNFSFFGGQKGLYVLVPVLSGLTGALDIWATTFVN